MDLVILKREKNDKLLALESAKLSKNTYDILHLSSEVVTLEGTIAKIYLDKGEVENAVIAFISQASCLCDLCNYSEAIKILKHALLLSSTLDNKKIINFIKQLIKGVTKNMEKQLKKNQLKKELFKIPIHRCDITKEFRFESAHSLPFHKGKCFFQHGHSYYGKVCILGTTDSNGMVFDYYDLGQLLNTYIMDKYDHKDLNEIFENTTAENLAYIIFWDIQRALGLRSKIIKVKYVLIKETNSSEAIYYGN